MFFIAARTPTSTNLSLLSACEQLGVDGALLPPEEIAERVRRGDAVLARLDVMPSLDGVEPGLLELRRLQHRRVRILNRPLALLTAHDKLATALRLARSGVPHPKTAHVDGGKPLPELELPVVVKPRFGSWGRDVIRCESRAAFVRAVRRLRRRKWFQEQGALVQELVPPRGFDLRLLVAGGEVVGAIERRAARGEWRTNVSLGGARHRVVPPPEACAQAVAAAAAVGADLVGVDLLPSPSGGHVVLELNGAVDFTSEYSLDGRDVFTDAVGALALDHVESCLIRAGSPARQGGGALRVSAGSRRGLLSKAETHSTEPKGRNDGPLAEDGKRSVPSR